MSRHVFLTQFEAASSLDSFDPGVFLNFTFASSFNKMMETEQKLPNVSTAKGTIFESVDVPVALASSWQLLYGHFIIIKFKKFIFVFTQFVLRKIHFHLNLITRIYTHKYTYIITFLTYFWFWKFKMYFWS